MSVFGSIFSKIFHHGQPAAPATAPVEASATAAAPSVDVASAEAVAPAAATHDEAAAPVAPAVVVDVEAVLTEMATHAGQTLDWRHSIVDMMKLLGLDSSLAARKELATELHYSGDMGDSASMNIWLHKQVMTKLAENGGKVPDDLKH